MERKKGFLVIDDYSFLNQEIDNGKYSYGWVQNKQNELFLFKNYFFHSFCYRELLVSKLMDLLNIKNVGYDLAVYQEKYGVITKSCTQNQTISMKEMILNCLTTIPISITTDTVYSFFNVKTLLWLLNKNYGKQHHYDEQKVFESLIDAFLSQILFGNCDLNAKNLELDEKTLRFLPLYDFGGCASVQLNRKGSKTNSYCLKRVFAANYQESPKATLEEFLRVGTKVELEKLKMYLEQLQTVSLKRVTQELEDELETKLPFSFSFLKLNLTKNWERVNQFVKKTQESSK